MATMNLTSLWLHASTSFQWHTFTVHTHAVALFCVYVFWYVNWNLPLRLGDDKDNDLATPPPPPSLKRQSPFKIVKTTKSSKDIPTPPSPTVSLSSDESCSTDDEKSEHQSAIEAVTESCPEATSVEVERFLTARAFDVPSAIRVLRHYLDWNHEHETIKKEHNIERKSTDNHDKDIWMEAVAIAMKAAGESGEPNLPQVIRTYKVNGGSVTDLEGHRIFHIMPAQMDNKLSQGSTYALATALFLNLHLDRNGSERITVCMDVRAGKGWPNVHAMRQVPFMKATTNLLLSLFPERLHKCLVFPVPSTFLWIWNVVSKILDQLTRDKICVLGGPNRIISPPPLEGMIPHLGKEVAELLEEARVADFKE